MACSEYNITKKSVACSRMLIRGIHFRATAKCGVGDFESRNVATSRRNLTFKQVGISGITRIIAVIMLRRPVSVSASERGICHHNPSATRNEGDGR